MRTNKDRHAVHEGEVVKTLWEGARTLRADTLRRMDTQGIDNNTRDAQRIDLLRGDARNGAKYLACPTSSGSRTLDRQELSAVVALLFELAAYQEDCGA